MGAAETIVRLEQITKRYPGVLALSEVDFDLRPGEVHALMGENGAGKSTLIKILAGAERADSGTVRLFGAEQDFRRPLDAIRAGISVIYQELNLCSSVSIAENVYFGRLPRRRGVEVDYRRLYADTRSVLDRVGFDADPRLKVAFLSTAQQQLVEICKAISCDAKVVVMDEPTSALAPAEIEHLFTVIRDLKARGTAIVYVSHKLEEIFAVADRVTVLRDGARVATEDIGALTHEKLISLMVGRSMGDLFQRRPQKPGESVLEVEDLSNDRISGASFHVRAGEIVGFSGLMGSGRTELAKAVFGFDPRRTGKVSVAGTAVPPSDTAAAKRAGMGFVPEDRKQEGIFPYLSVGRNVTVAAGRELSGPTGRLRLGAERAAAAEAIGSLQIKTPSADQLIQNLSGGNQQKAILGRWLVMKDVKVLIVDEPTRGIDVGAKREIYAILDGLAAKGMAIVVMSSELPEILAVCDRIYVMNKGRIAAELPRAEATQEAILAKCL